MGDRDMTTNSKPTPGEWRRVHDHPDESCRLSIAHIVSDARRAGNEIATLYQCDAEPEQAANADLIAAAPELLEALRPFAALLAAHHADVPDDRPIFGINDAVFTAGDLRAAAAAIARAEGKS